jgi:hypothetical protein
LHNRGTQSTDDDYDDCDGYRDDVEGEGVEGLSSPISRPALLGPDTSAISQGSEDIIHSSSLHTTPSTEDPGTKDHHISEPEELEGAEVREQGRRWKLD